MSVGNLRLSRTDSVSFVQKPGKATFGQAGCNSTACPTSVPTWCAASRLCKLSKAALPDFAVEHNLARQRSAPSRWCTTHILRLCAESPMLDPPCSSCVAFKAVWNAAGCYYWLLGASVPRGKSVPVDLACSCAPILNLKILSNSQLPFSATRRG